MHMMEIFLKNINTKSDEKVYIVSCRVKQLYLLVIYFPLLKEFQENWPIYASTCTY